MSTPFPPPVVPPLLLPPAPEEVSPAERARRRAGLWVQLLWSPIVFLGIVLTLSLYGLIIGVPLLILSVPPFLAGRRRRKDRRVPRVYVAIGVLAVGALVAYAAWYLIAGPPGANEGGGHGDVLGWIAVGAWSLTTLWMTARLWPRSVLRNRPDRADSEGQNDCSV